MKEILNNKKLKSVSICKINMLGILNWEDIYEIIKEIKGNNFKIIICENKMKCDELRDRDKIFEELHESPIGGHRGFLKTYRRIR